ncbi:MAG: class I SAM-dependent methyltransferase [Bacteroidota bacterium]
MSNNNPPAYLLGINEAELERLRFQQIVWGPVTDRFFDRLGVQQGWRCLDVGAGPGLVTAQLRERVGDTGAVTALEPAKYYLELFAQEVQKRRWTNVKLLQGTVEEASLPSRHYDLIFARWVASFVPDLETFFTRLVAALRPGGIIAFQDYYYEGLSLFPRGGAWDRMPDVVRAFYQSGSGNPYVAAALPSLFRKHGITLIDYTPNCLAGGPDSGVFEWAGRFFTTHIPLMAEKGIITKHEADALQADWDAHRKNPDALLFSPIVVDVAGKLESN